jgi:hypothetical protein
MELAGYSIPLVSAAIYNFRTQDGPAVARLANSKIASGLLDVGERGSQRRSENTRVNSS